MMKYLYLFAFFIFLAFMTHGQVKIQKTNDGRGVRFLGTLVHYNAQGAIISENEFAKLVNSDNYVLETRGGGGDTLCFFLRSKDSSEYIGKKVPAIEFKDVNGETFVAGRKGRQTILTFWGDKCEPCIGLIDALDSLAVQYKKADFIALATYGDTRKFADLHPWKFVRVPLEYKSEYRPYFPEPTLVFIDQKGILKHIYWDRDIKKVIQFLNGTH